MIVIVIVLICIFQGMGKNEENEYLRIHIRANSNSAIDQEVKYKVKDEVVDSLIPLLADVRSKEDAFEILQQNLLFIENVANRVLEENGFLYTSTALLCEEEFPTRKYDNLVLESGYYDALILNLGMGEGDNWWCVVYPPLCFTSSENSTNFVYISKILEIIRSIGKK